VTPHPDPGADDPDALADRIAALAPVGTRPLIALDHDGVLSPIAPRPEDARLTAGVPDALAALASVAEIAIVSGRGLDDLQGRFADLPVMLVAEHGLRVRSRDGAVTQLVPGLAPATLEALRVRLATILPGGTGAPDVAGWLVEDKEVGLAVHHRLVPDEALEPTRTAVVRALEEAAALPPGGHVQMGKAVVELRAAGADKGAALRVLAAAHPGSTVVMVGDDLTDEPALHVAEASGGVGVLVADTARSTSASARLTGPDEVVTLLTALARRLRQGR
jgi:trehalose 6-phosphate phosphatase